MINANNQNYSETLEQISELKNGYFLRSLINNIIRETQDISIFSECLNLFVKANDTYEIEDVIDIILQNYPEKFNTTCNKLIDFRLNCDIGFCIDFLEQLYKKRKISSLSDEKINEINKIEDAIHEAIQEKHRMKAGLI